MNPPSHFLSLRPALFRSFSVLAAVCVLLACPVAARAATKIFVASFGSDGNAGTSISPKRNFQAAHDAVSAGGEIVALDTAGYGGLTISKAVTVAVPPGVIAFVTGASITINAGANNPVNLRGLTIEGAATGIQINTARNVSISDCVVRGCTYGISDAGTSPVTVADTAVQDCSDYGLQVKTTSGVALVTVVRCRFTGDYYGIYAADNAHVTVRDSSNDGIAPDNNHAYSGFFAAGGPAGNAVLACDNCTITNCYVGFGANYLNTGGSGTLYLSNCTATGNQVGADGDGANKLYSYGNNHFFGNSSVDAGTTTAISGK